MKARYMLAAFALLGACAGNPLNNGGPGTGGGGSTPPGSSGTTVPPELAKDMQSAQYDANAQTLTITMLPFDGSPQSASYQRGPTGGPTTALDVGGFQEYELQQNGQARRYIALFKKAGTVYAGVAGTEWRYASQHGGSIYGRADVYSGPTTGIATYQGSYAAVLTVPIDDTDPNPSQYGPVRVSGNAKLNVDFNQQLVEGNITGRKIVDTGTVGYAATLPSSLEDVQLQQGTLKSGTFFGNATRADGTKLGNYGGVVQAGNSTTAGANVAGTVVFTPYDTGQKAAYTEYGAFVLPLKCYAANGATCP